MRQYGMTLPRYGEPTFLGSILSTEDSPARTLALPAAEQAWAESEADYSSRSSGSLAKYDLDSSSWRTSQRLLFEEQNELLANFAAYGMTVDGSLYRLQTSEQTTKENDGGCWPTPCARDHHPNGMKPGSKVDLGNAVKMWPTPTSRDWKGPQANEYKQMRGEETKFKMESLPGAVGQYPTPAANPSRGLRSGEPNDKNRIRLEPTGGQLNPTWVEWLMGYPSEYTVCEPWAIAWFQPKRGKRLKG